MPAPLRPRHFYYKGHGTAPALEVWNDDRVQQTLPLNRLEPDSHADEAVWCADLAQLPDLPATGEWQFRLNLGDGQIIQPEFAPAFTTTLRTLWMQKGSLYSYQPDPQPAPARVIKLPDFEGSLGVRPLYIYLPRGYDQHTDRRYPVLYMHDGQNCFDAYVDDSYAGAWQADRAADLLVREGLMQECIIVGVSNGQEARILEYLPPYARHLPPPRRPTRAVNLGDAPPMPRRPLAPVPGRAAQTVAYYRGDVSSYVNTHYRTLTGREHTATCGSSLGGLFSIYIAWEHTDFARSHAALSTSFWATRNSAGKLEAIERIRTGERRDIRLWLDSGTFSSPGHGNDGQRETAEARRALLQAGYHEGTDFQYYLDNGAIHSESSWAARLPLIFQFLFPAE